MGSRPRQALALVEIVAAVVLLSLMILGGTTYYLGTLAESRLARVQEELARIRDEVHRHALVHGGQLPDTLDRLKNLTPQPPIDPWDRLYVMQPKARRLLSGGPNGQIETADEPGTAVQADDIGLLLVSVRSQARAPSAAPLESLTATRDWPCESGEGAARQLSSVTRLNFTLDDRQYWHFLIGPVLGCSPYSVLVHWTAGRRAVRIVHRRSPGTEGAGPGDSSPQEWLVEPGPGVSCRLVYLGELKGILCFANGKECPEHGGTAPSSPPPTADAGGERTMVQVLVLCAGRASGTSAGGK